MKRKMIRHNDSRLHSSMWVAGGGEERLENDREKKLKGIKKGRGL